MKKIRKPSRGIALVLAAALALTPLAGFPLPAFAAGEKAPQHAVTAATTPGDSSPDSNTQNTPPTSNDSETHDPGVNDSAAPALPKDENTVTDPAGDAPVASELPATDVLGEKEATPPTKALITPNILATPAAKAAGDLAISKDNFPDAAFRGYVKKTLAKNNDTMTAEQVAKVTYINVTYDVAGTVNKITNLKGIENFTNLQVLLCGNNALKELSIAANTKLTTLECNDNELSALVMTDNLLLGEVNCVGNFLNTLNLEKNTALTSLLCGFNNLDKLDVSKNTNLIQLNCQNNKLPALDVEVNTQLTSLFCQGNQLSSLILPTGNTLTILVCHDNHLATLDLQDHQAVGTRPNYPSTIRPQTVAADLAQQPDGSYVLDMAAIVGLANIARVDTRMFVDENIVSNIYNPTTGKATFAALPSTVTYYYQTEGDTKVALMRVNIDPLRVAYTITATADAVGGTITPAGETKVYKGGSQEYTFKANEGYELGKVTVDNVEVPASEIKAGTYTINNVQANTAIHAAFTKKIDPQPPITYYSVTASAGDNGYINPVGTRIVPQGSSLEYKFEAKDGYELDVVTVNGTAVKPVGGAYTLSNIRGATTIHATFKAIDPPVDPTDPVDPVDPPKPPVDPTDPVDPPKPPVDPADPINPPTPPAVPDNGGNNNGTTTIVERTNTVVVPAAPQAAAPTSPATPAAAEAKAAAPAKPAADTATPQGQPENSDLGAQAFDTQHSHIPLALLLLAVWLVGGFAVIRQRKHTHDAIERASY